MIVNTVKQRMLDGQPGIGAGVGLGAPTSAALLAQARNRKPINRRARI